MSTPPVLSPTCPEVTDLDVIREVLGGDTRKFSVLVQRHNQAVFRACRAVLGNDAEAEDAVQTAWVNAYRALASFRAEATVRTWVTRIAIREASARLRRRPQHTVSLEDVTVATDTSPADDLLAEEVSRLLGQQLDALPEAMRTVIVLRDILELDTAETAACLGVAEPAVRVRLHRARQALAKNVTETMTELGEHALHTVWRFDGERCARVQAVVLAAILADASSDER